MKRTPLTIVIAALLAIVSVHLNTNPAMASQDDRRSTYNWEPAWKVTATFTDDDGKDDVIEVTEVPDSVVSRYEKDSGYWELLRRGTPTRVRKVRDGKVRYNADRRYQLVHLTFIFENPENPQSRPFIGLFLVPFDSERELLENFEPLAQLIAKKGGSGYTEWKVHKRKDAERSVKPFPDRDLIESPGKKISLADVLEGSVKSDATPQQRENNRRFTESLRNSGSGFTPYWDPDPNRWGPGMLVEVTMYGQTSKTATPAWSPSGATWWEVDVELANVGLFADDVGQIEFSLPVNAEQRKLFVDDEGKAVKDPLPANTFGPTIVDRRAKVEFGLPRPVRLSSPAEIAIQVRWRSGRRFRSKEITVSSVGEVLPTLEKLQSSPEEFELPRRSKPMVYRIDMRWKPKDNEH